MRLPLALMLALTGLGCGASVTVSSTADVPVVAADVPVVAADVPVAVVDVPVAVVDVPVAVVDAPVVTGDLPLGSDCARDSQCASGLCANTPGIVTGCAQPCIDDAACIDLAADSRCVLDRAPGGARFACGTVVTAVAERAQPCTADAECFSGFCADGLCHNACADDTGCTAGWRCRSIAAGVGGVQACGASAITGVTVEDFVLFGGSALVDRGTPTLDVIAPPDTVSLTWVTQDLAGSDLYATVASVTAPDARSLVDVRTWNTLHEQPVRTIPSRIEINTATFPGRDMDPMVPGMFHSVHALLNTGTGARVTSRTMRALVRVKRAPGGVAANGWTLRLTITMGGVAGLSAATAPTNARLQAAIARMRALYATVGVNVTVVGYNDLNAADAAQFSTIDSQDELHAIFQRSAGMIGDVLPIFIVRGISSTAGLENAIGIAGGINGPPGIYGTTSSGVVVSWDNTLSRRVDLLGQVMAHESGHYLGLWHTMENLPACTATGQMNCSIWGGVDNLGDTPNTMAGASTNLMYWVTDGTNMLLSAAQGLMMRGSAIVH